LRKNEDSLAVARQRFAAADIVAAAIARFTVDFAAGLIILGLRD
jgi:hypothetical protein